MDRGTIIDDEEESRPGMSGILLKLSPSGVVKRYLSRWFVIVANQLSSELVYHTSNTKQDTKGRINLEDAIAIKSFSSTPVSKGMFAAKGPEEHLRFELVCKDRVYDLAATSKEDKDAWLAALATATDLKVQDAAESLQNASGYSGVLLKQSGGTKRSKTWASRHFVLEKFDGIDPTLKYYAQAGEAKEKGVVLLADVTEIRSWATDDGVEQPPIGHRFELVTRNRVFVLAATQGGSEKQAWLDKIAAACEVEVSQPSAEWLEVHSKSASLQKWDHEGPLVTRKKNASLGWKDRFGRLQGSSLIIYRDGNSPVIKETMDLQSLSLESIKVKETGGTFRFRLHDNEDGFSDWGTTSEALRTEWLNKLIAAGCKIMATDMKVNERIRSDTLDAQAKEIGMDTCPVDYGGSVFVLKSSRQVLSGSWKKRVLRIKGCRLTWAHGEDSNDVDGMLCLDHRWKLHVYAPSEKMFPFALEFASKSQAEGYGVDKITFAVALEDVRTSWTSKLIDVIAFAQALTVKVVANTITNELVPAKEALEAASKEVKEGDSELSGDAAEEVSRLQQLIQTLEADLEAKQENLMGDNFVNHEETLVTGVTDVRVAAKVAARKAPKKKRTFGKARAAMEAPANDEDDEKPSPTEADSTKAASSTSPPSPPDYLKGNSTSASDLPPKKTALVSEVIEVLPEQVAPEAIPEAVYATPEPAVTPGEASKACEDSKVVLATGEGYVFRGRWTYPWLELADFDAKTMAATTPGPPPAVVSFRTDLGATELVRCY